MSDTKQTIITRPEQHDRANDELGFRFVRALAVEKASLDQSLELSSIRVLGAISYFMNATTKRAWPSYRQIAEVTGYSEDRIERAIKKLRENGYIFSERRSPITGGRALVHYGLSEVHPKQIELLVAAAVKELKAALTPAKITASDTTPARITGSEKSSSDSKALKADPGKNNGVGSPRRPRRCEGADPGVSAASDPGVFADSNPVSENPVSEVSKPSAIADNLFGNTLDAEPAVKRYASSFAVHLPGQDVQRVTLQWLKGQRDTAPDELLMAFAETELHRFVAERPMTRQGKPMTLYGFLGVAFTYRFDPWLQSYRKPTSTTPRRRGFTA